jgi:hypothetical protein
MHINIHILTFSLIHTHTHFYILQHMHACARVCARTHTHTHSYTKQYKLHSISDYQHKMNTTELRSGCFSLSEKEVGWQSSSQCTFF